MKYFLGLLLLCVCWVSVAQNDFARPDIPGEIMIDIGFNRWNEMPAGTDREFWPSKSIGIYYSRRKALGNKLSFNYGIGLGLEKMALGDSTLFSGDSTVVGPLPFDLQGLRRNKLAFNYIDIPIEFRFHPMGTEDGEGFFIGAGGIVGIRLNTHTKWVYREQAQTKTQKLRARYDMNQFRYGIQLRLGFRGIHGFYKQYFSNVFTRRVGGANPTMMTFGVNITGF